LAEKVASFVHIFQILSGTPLGETQTLALPSPAKKKPQNRGTNLAVEFIFSPILDALMMFSSLHRRRKRVVQEEEIFETNKKERREKSSRTVGAHPSAFATPETITLISGVISEYKAAPETNCIKAINAKKAVNNFVAVNCMLCIVILFIYARV